MSFRELSTIEIQEVLRRWSAGQAVRAVARETGVDRTASRSCRSREIPPRGAAR